MQRLRFLSLLISLGFLAHPVLGAIRAHFSLDYSAWNATHVVMVATTPTDGAFEVVESWRGDLPAGARIVIPDLRPNQNAIPISRYSKEWPFYGEGSEQIPREPVGSRMILFLKKGAGETNVPPNTKRQPWEPSDLMNSMKASVLWIDDGRVYGFEQFMNPGPAVLSPETYYEGDVRSRVEQISALRQSITEVLALKNGVERAERLKPFLLSEVMPAHKLALEQLGKCGPSAVGTILRTLDDPNFSDEASDLVKALVEAGGQAIGPELTRRLQQELAFWRSTAPSLSHDWWNADTSPHAPLRERYSQTLQLIIGLEQTHYSASLSTAIQLRDLWRSLPQLADHTQLPDECDKLIGKLQIN